MTNRGGLYYAAMTFAGVPTLAEVKAIAGAGEVRSKRVTTPRPPCYLPDSPARCTVELWAGARESIEFEARRYVTGRETGGWFLGHHSNTSRVTARAASGPGVNSSRDTGRMTRSLGHGEACAQQHGLDIVGSRHAHPDGCTELSDDDMRTCAEILDALRSSATDPDTLYVEIIATPRGPGWGRPS